MALPVLDEAQRKEALARAAETRTKRAQIKRSLKSGTQTLTSVLDQGDTPLVGKMKIVDLLRSLPGMGKVRATQMMTELRIAENRRVSGLTERQRSALDQQFGD